MCGEPEVADIVPAYQLVSTDYRMKDYIWKEKKHVTLKAILDVHHLFTGFYGPGLFKPPENSWHFNDL